jgi:integrase
MPWAEIDPLYLKYLKAATRSPRTIELRTYQIDKFRRAHPGLEAEDVTDDILVDYMGNPDWAPNTKGVVRSSITGYFGFAFRKGLLPDDPSKDLPTVRVPKGVPKPASLEAINDALEQADERVQLMITIGARVGARAMEIAQVHARDVEGVPGRYSLRIKGKGSKTRLVPLQDDLADRILAHAPDYVFPGKDNGHISPAYVSRLVSRALPPGVTCHKLRHRFATQVIKSGGELLALQRLMGHASVATTQGYVGIDDDQLRDAAMGAW